MNEIILPYNFTQEEFDSALAELKNKVTNKGADIQIIVKDPQWGTITVVDGYIDADVVDGDNGKEFVTCPHFWYNKQLLDSKGVKY